MSWFILLILSGVIGYLIGRIQENLTLVKVLERARFREETQK